MLLKPSKNAGGALVALLLVTVIVGLVVYLASPKGAAVAQIDPRTMVSAAAIEPLAPAETKAGSEDLEEKAYRDALHRPAPAQNPILSKVSKMVEREPIDEQF